MSNLWPEKWSRSLKKLEQLNKRVFTTDLQSGRLRKVVTYEKWSLEELTVLLIYSSGTASTQFTGDVFFNVLKVFSRTHEGS